MKNNKSKKKIIGILGGMGPLASANLYYKIIKIAQEEYRAEQDEDYPPLIINNIGLLGFDETGFVKPDLVKNQLVTGLKTLEKAGCDLIFMACNTVYYFYKDLQKIIRIPILNIIEITIKKIQEGKYKIVGLLSSESTKKVKIYQNALKKKNIRTISTTDKQQKEINKVILHIMKGVHNKKDTNVLKKIIKDMENKGAQAIIIGCTEMPLVIHQKDCSIKLFDTTEIITKYALEISLNKKTTDS